MSPRASTDLHGNAPDSSPVALLIIDAINDLEFDGGAGMLTRAIRMARRIARLKAKASALRIPTIYVNDKFRALAVRLSPHGRPLPRGGCAGTSGGRAAGA